MSIFYKNVSKMNVLGQIYIVKFTGVIEKPTFIKLNCYLEKQIERGFRRLSKSKRVSFCSALIVFYHFFYSSLWLKTRTKVVHKKVSHGYNKVEEEKVVYKKVILN